MVKLEEISTIGDIKKLNAEERKEIRTREALAALKRIFGNGWKDYSKVAEAFCQFAEIASNVPDNAYDPSDSFLVVLSEQVERLRPVSYKLDQQSDLYLQRCIYYTERLAIKSSDYRKKNGILGNGRARPIGSEKALPKDSEPRGKAHLKKLAGLRGSGYSLGGQV